MVHFLDTLLSSVLVHSWIVELSIVKIHSFISVFSETKIHSPLLDMLLWFGSFRSSGTLEVLDSFIHIGTLRLVDSFNHIGTLLGYRFTPIRWYSLTHTVHSSYLVLSESKIHSRQGTLVVYGSLVDDGTLLEEG